MKFLRRIWQRPTSVSPPEVSPVVLPPLPPLPRTRVELTATAEDHHQTLSRADGLLRVTRILEDYRAGDQRIRQKG